MERAINTLGMAIIAGKYTLMLLLAGLTISSGNVADGLLLAGIESND